MDKELEQIRLKKIESLKQKMEHGGPLVVTDDEFENVIAKNDIVLVDFWAPWCGPCRMLAPTMEELARKYAGKIVVGKMNIDEEQMTASKFGIMSIPTVMFFKKGKPADKIVGTVPKEKFEAKIQALLQ